MRNLAYYRKFYLEFKDTEILHTLCKIRISPLGHNEIEQQKEFFRLQHNQENKDE